MSNAHSSTSSNNIVGVHYRVGKKIGEGSFGVIFEGAQSRSCPRPCALHPAFALSFLLFVLLARGR